MRNTLLILTLFVLSAGCAWAQGETRFFAKTEPEGEEVAVGEAIEVSFTLENGSGTGKLGPIDWESAGFVLMGSSQSSSISISGGETRASASYNFTVMPSEAGEKTIPAVSIKVGGKEWWSEPIKLHVLPGDENAVPRNYKRSPAVPSQPDPEPKKKIKTIRM